ncbi:hypothetical protein HF086_017741 [Spodoptera exigua]|uniref:Ionotropic receptor n=1 Tax=Spodoptera exigua TaxID=7107 RepID=A0A922MAS3_SPOEX|nr:hypothetical protein HF086_017741 [Spodoptera exigua]
MELARSVREDSSDHPDVAQDSESDDRTIYGEANKVTDRCGHSTPYEVLYHVEVYARYVQHQTGRFEAIEPIFKYITILCSYDMHRVNTWGYQRNGSFDGMVNALYQGMAEIGGAPIFYRIDRGQRVQYISEVWMSSDVVWYCVVAMLAVTAIILWVMLVVQKGDNEESSLSLAGLVIWGAICQQVSSLLLEPPRNIRTLKDILDSDLKVGAHDIVYDKDYFKRTTDPVAIELYHKKVATGTHYNFFTPEEGIALVKKGGFAFHIDTTFAFPLIKATFTEREICETNLVQMYPLQRMGVVVRKHSPYKEHIAYAIRKMYEVGLPPRIQSEIDEPMPECAHTPDSSIFCVGIREFSTPLLALAIGMITSIIVLFCEIIFDRVVKINSVRDFRH